MMENAGFLVFCWSCTFTGMFLNYNENKLCLKRCLVKWAGNESLAIQWDEAAVQSNEHFAEGIKPKI